VKRISSDRRHPGLPDIDTFLFCLGVAGPRCQRSRPAGYHFATLGADGVTRTGPARRRRARARKLAGRPRAVLGVPDLRTRLRGEALRVNNPRKRKRHPRARHLPAPRGRHAHRLQPVARCRCARTPPGGRAEAGPDGVVRPLHRPTDLLHEVRRGLPSFGAIYAHGADRGIPHQVRLRCGASPSAPSTVPSAPSGSSPSQPLTGSAKAPEKHPELRHMKEVDCQEEGQRRSVPLCRDRQGRAGRIGGPMAIDPVTVPHEAAHRSLRRHGLKSIPLPDGFSWSASSGRGFGAKIVWDALAAHGFLRSTRLGPTTPWPSREAITLTGMYLPFVSRQVLVRDHLPRHAASTANSARAGASASELRQAGWT